MKRIVIVLLGAVFLSGCDSEKPIPTSRLVQQAGQFSFVTPDGWFRTQLSGVNFIIVSTEPDFGAVPNIFVESVEKSTELSNAVSKLIKNKKNNHPTYKVSQQRDFVTESGLKAIKISARRNNGDALPLALFHYLIQDGDRVIVINCLSAYRVRQKYEPIFDTAMKSLRSDKAG